MVLALWSRMPTSSQRYVHHLRARKFWCSLMFTHSQSQHFSWCCYAYFHDNVITSHRLSCPNTSNIPNLQASFDNSTFTAFEKYDRIGMFVCLQNQFDSLTNTFVKDILISCIGFSASPNHRKPLLQKSSRSRMILQKSTIKWIASTTGLTNNYGNWKPHWIQIIKSAWPKLLGHTKHWVNMRHGHRPAAPHLLPPHLRFLARATSMPRRLLARQCHH